MGPREQWTLLFLKHPHYQPRPLFENLLSRSISFWIEDREHLFYPFVRSALFVQRGMLSHYRALVDLPTDTKREVKEGEEMHRLLCATLGLEYSEGMKLHTLAESASDFLYKNAVLQRGAQYLTTMNRIKELQSHHMRVLYTLKKVQKIDFCLAIWQDIFQSGIV